jgi:hypothetical protein
VASLKFGHHSKVDRSCHELVEQVWALPVDICLLPSKRLLFQTKKTEAPQSGSISLLLLALIQTSRRWRNIRFFLSKNDAEMQLLQLSQDDVPLLKVINIASPPAAKTDEHILCDSLKFLAAPSIRSLTNRKCFISRSSVVG